jgi:ligand-binding sensor domain-containing protein
MFLAAAAGHGREQLSRDFLVRVWRIEHGLPDARVKALCQTSDGYLWVGTQRGLARFDGQYFTIFDHIAVPELLSDDCTALAEADGLWVGTTSGLVRQRGNRFKRYLFAPDGSTEPVQALCPAQAGGLWIAANTRLYFWDSRLDTIRLVSSGENPPWGAIHCLQEDHRGSLWVGAEAGLFRLPRGASILQSTPLGQSFERLPVMALRLAEDGKLWVLFAEQLDSTSRGGLAVAQSDSWLSEPQFMPEELQVAWRGRFLVADVFGTLWLPGFGDICRYGSGSFSGFSLPDVDGEEYPLCALSDREGTLWIGTEDSGLQQWIPRTLVTYTAGDGLVHDDVWTTCAGRDGAVWLGTEGGVSCFKDGRFTNVPMLMSRPESNVRSIVEDRDGNIWFGTIRALNRIRNGVITDYKFPGEWVETKIRALYPSQDGSIWVGTVRGLSRLSGGERARYTSQDGLPEQEVRALLEDRNGNLWVGTHGGGIACLRDGRFQTITTTNGLSNRNVWALHEDAQSFIWAGTEDGLNRIKDGKSRPSERVKAFRNERSTASWRTISADSG